MQKFVVIDVETTGQSVAKGDRMIEIALVMIENNQITKQYNQLINPGKPIPPFISQLTSITDDDVITQPSFAEVVDDFMDFFEDAVLVAHNVPFDLTFLNGELSRIGKNKINPFVLDTVELSRILFPKAPSYKLNELAEFLLITHENPHRAISDALVTGDLLILLLNKIQALPKNVIEQLLTISSPLRTDFSLVCKLSENTTNRNDIEVYRGFSLKRTLDHLVNNETIESDFNTFLEKMYKNDGQLAQVFPFYEERKGQVFISETIYDHFQKKEHALIEAETGIGKTIAYLIPAVYEALTNNNKVVISTSNTNLQTQLIDQDLEKLQLPISSTIIKGKSHYLSLQKFEHYFHDTSYRSYQDTLLKAMILVWLTETTSGDLDEIQFPIEKHPIFHQIVVGNERVHENWKDWCFYQRMLKMARQSSIIVTNHALLAIDMMTEQRILPDYQRLIIDEAHQLEQIATNYFGASVSYFELIAYFQQLEKNYANNPLFQEQLELVKYELDHLFRNLFQFVKRKNQQSKAVTDVGRLKAVWEIDNEQVIKDILDRTILMLKQLSLLLSQTAPHEQEQFQQLQQLIRKLLINSDSAAVTWLEIDQQGAENAVFIHREPFSIQKELNDHLFQIRESIILISATLTINQSFDYIKEKLGIYALSSNDYIVNHHFDYQKNVQLLIPNDLPTIQYPDNDAFIYAVNEAIISITERTKGKILVLFTSYDMLRKSFYLLKETDLLSDYLIIGQGVSSGSRNRLIKQFQGFDQSILLGTNAYWEGIDIPGNDLTCLIIVKLPFRSPQDPVFVKKSDYFKDKGINPFMELALPQAILQFKQGFGRLIRKESDYGSIFVFDDRIMTKRYGKSFINSIPTIPIEYDTMDNLLIHLEKRH